MRLFSHAEVVAFEIVVGNVVGFNLAIVVIEQPDFLSAMFHTAHTRLGVLVPPSGGASMTKTDAALQAIPDCQ